PHPPDFLTALIWLLLFVVLFLKSLPLQCRLALDLRQSSSEKPILSYQLSYLLRTGTEISVRKMTR
ncbi:hypothetical protein LEMLEM_LOCUS26601, partial [Lemmus lemmus]